MKFIALGAADSVGASCYFLQVDGLNLLLDCGKGFLRGGKKTYGPDFTPLIPRILTSLSQLDAILITHGHYDHIGYLPEIIHQCPNTPIYATHLTQKLGWYLMLDRCYEESGASMEKRIGVETSTRRVLERIQPLNYLQPIRIGPVQITFYEAGHVPGAAMILIESRQEGSLLYTGDFCKVPSKLAMGYCLSSKVRPDTLLMCGLHAKHPHYESPDNRNRLLKEICGVIGRNGSCLLPTRELTKGMELVGFLADKMESGQIPGCPIFMDDHIWTLSERLQENGLSVLSGQCCRFPRALSSRKPGIYVGGNSYRRYFDQVHIPMFSLHGSYRDCVDLVSALQPRTVILVHSPPDSEWGHHGDTALESEFPGAAFLYPAVGHSYDLE